MDQTASLIKTLSNDTGFLAGVSPAMLLVEGVIAEIAATNIPVLLVGESGTGKQVIAQRIHLLSLYGTEPLRKVACASMTCETFSADLGLSGNAGESRAAGTVLFDEISEMESSCQRMLLHALPDGETTPRAGTISARVISATSRNIDQDVRAGRFRSELYYRLNGVCLRLPPLRKRKDDILPLTDFFLTKHATQLSRPRPSLNSRTLRMLLDYSWPGNIRELENVVKNIVALGEDNVPVSDLSAATLEQNAMPTASGYSLKAAARAASRETERELILKALARTRWNRKRAAQQLQISYKSLLYKLKHIGLPDSESN